MNKFKELDQQELAYVLDEEVYFTVQDVIDECNELSKNLDLNDYTIYYFNDCIGLIYKHGSYHYFSIVSFRGELLLFDALKTRHESSTYSTLRIRLSHQSFYSE